MKNIVLILLSFLISAVSVSAAEFNFDIDKSIVVVGDKFVVKLILSGSDSTLGTDAIVLYDPNILKVESVTSSKLYPTYNPVANQRIDASKGKILLSGSAGIGKPVNAEGEFARINFSAIKSGSTNIKFDYQKGSTTKTGIVSPSGKELLASEPRSLTVIVKDPSILQKILNWISKILLK